MKASLKGVVEKDFDGKSLLDFLKLKMEVSLSLIKRAKLIENGITVNGKHTFVNAEIHENDLVEIIIQTDEECSKNIPISENEPKIVYEDEYLLVIDKQGNIPTHPSLNNYGESVAGMVLGHYLRQGKSFVFRPVNRLDKGTSGLMVIAKNPFIHEKLKLQLHSNLFKREYLCLVCGKTNKSGEIEAPISRVDTSIIKRKVDKNGDYAKTIYKSLKYFDNYSLVSVKLLTGRTHQIRVHFSFIGHPLYADFLYGDEQSDLSRPALHSHYLNLKHPMTNEFLEFTSPIPYDIDKKLKALEK